MRVHTLSHAYAHTQENILLVLVPFVIVNTEKPPNSNMDNQIEVYSYKIILYNNQNE